MNPFGIKGSLDNPIHVKMEDKARVDRQRIEERQTGRLKVSREK